MYRVGLIRVLTVTDTGLLNSHGNLIQRVFPDLVVDSKCIPDHPKGVHDDKTFLTAIPLVVDLAMQFERRGFDAVIVSCAGDPGVEEARREVSIPVIGAGRAMGAIALSLGRRIGVMGITEEVPSNVKDVLGDHMIAYTYPEGVNNTLDLMSTGGAASAVAGGLDLKSRGADVIGLACTGLSSIAAAVTIAKATGLRVIDPVIAAGLATLAAVKF